MSFRSMLENVKFASNLGRPIPRQRRRPAPRTRPGIEPLEGRSLLSTFTVVNNNDTPANSSYIPPGSLRDAIIRVNADTQPGVDTINFAIGSGVQTIRLGSYALPTIKHPVVIDGTSQPGFAGTPLIELDGTKAFYSGGNGLSINAGNSTVKGLVINRFNGAGIYLYHSGGDTIAGNYIGTDITGTVALGNRNGGVTIWNGTGGDVIGGTTAATRNLISGNGGSVGSGAGVFVNAPGNIVEGNYIGTDVAGTHALGNHGAGVTVQTIGNSVGGTVPGAGNLIAYNDGDGVRVNAGTGHAIHQNSIFANGGLGIDLQGTANNSQAAPKLTSAAGTTGTATIQGTLTSTPNTTFTLEIFSNPAGTSQGQTILGSITVTTDATGLATFATTFQVFVPKGRVITVTATDPLGNTSAFSSGIALA